MESLRPKDFLEGQDSGAIVIDVRSPKEFASGHLPGAFNLPLFTDEERAEVGTLYKQQGREIAVLKGLEIVGPKMRPMVEQVKFWMSDSSASYVLVHCWRGGMRSGSVGWLLSTVGIEVKLLKGGYKAYRNYIRTQFSKPVPLLVVGGLTGSGKTELLQRLENDGEQFLDLEGIAHHKGSAFGPLGQLEQPTTEQFENNCFAKWRTFDFSKLVLLEGESPNIGRVRINDALLEQMRFADLLIVELSRMGRLKRIMNEYGHFAVADLIDTSKRIEKKLGGQNLKIVLEHLNAGRIEDAADILLDYYDRSYWHSLKKKGTQWIDHLLLEAEDFEDNYLIVKSRIAKYKQDKLLA